VENQPLISVIVAVFNAAKTLQRCIDSVMGQTYQHKELIIIDGGSTDGTVEILKANSDKITYWESKPDRGIYHAWNKALGRAEGEWICFLGGDDYFWQRNVLECVVPHLRQAAAVQVGVVYGRLAIVNAKGEILEMEGQPWEDSERRFQQEMAIPHVGTMHHQSLFARHGLFDESFRIAADYDFLLRELKSHRATFVPGLIIAGMQLGGGSSIPSQQFLAIREVARARRNNEITSLSPRLFKRLIRALVRLGISKVVGERATDLLVDCYRVGTGKPRKWTR